MTAYGIASSTEPLTHFVQRPGKLKSFTRPLSEEEGRDVGKANDYQLPPHKLFDLDPLAPGGIFLLTPRDPTAREQRKTGVIPPPRDVEEEEGGAKYHVSASIDDNNDDDNNKATHRHQPSHEMSRLQHGHETLGVP